MRPFRAPVLLFVLFTLFSAVSFGVQPDRIAAPLTGGQVAPLRGNVHGMARAQFDQGRVDAATRMSGVSLVFKPSAGQQSDLDKLLADQQNPSSPKYHKWLTPAQFADRFGMSRNDIAKVTAWLQSQGLTVTRVANSRNQIFFEGAVAQVESAFRTQIHNYLVDGELHYANASEPAVPAALAGMTLGLHNLHNFQPKPRVKVRRAMFNEIHSHLTSHATGNHFLTPGDFATIYDVQALYTAGVDGTGETIAVIGQSAISLTDIHNFRNAAGLAANDPTLVLVPGSGTSTHCAGDEGESDLDLEWTGGVAKKASITFVYVGLGTGTTCANRTFGAFDALQYSVDKNIAAFISNSYGLCENANSSIGITQADALTIQGWAKQANTQGQTIVAATGDTGAADCDFGASVAKDGLAVDIPASIPEVTGAGGTAFNGDGPGTVTGTPPNTDVSATIYWSGTTSSTDTISSALSYIPEIAWNDTVPGSPLSASGGGASIYFAKPTWQTGTGVPSDGKRDVPDIAVSASPSHDAYLICSPTDGFGNPGCTGGFRDIQGFFDTVGGTSVSAPTFAATLALIDQYLFTRGFQATSGIGNANPNLYHIATYSQPAFNDITSGDNIVPCTNGTPGCPASGVPQFGFSAGTGYDQVTGLGSINGTALALAWGDLLTPSSASISASAPQIIQGINETFTVTVTTSSPSPASGTVSLSNNGSALGTATVSGGTATFSTTTLPPGTNSVSATYNGIFATSASSAVTVTVTPPSYTLSSNVATVAVIGGSSAQATLTLTPANNFPQSITFTCTGLPAESSCIFSPTSVTPNGAAVTESLSIKTTARVARLNAPFERAGRIFYAMLLPGLLGIVVSAGSRNRALRQIRLLSLMVVLGFSTLWLGACGNSSTIKDPGTPKGTSPIVVTATTNGANPVTQTVTINLTVN
jgi:subtilase family serine protease